MITLIVFNFKQFFSFFDKNNIKLSNLDNFFECLSYLVKTFWFLTLLIILQPQLEEERRQKRQAKLRLVADINERRCAACPLYGEDLFKALRIGKPSTACRWHEGWVYCGTPHKESARTRKEFFSRTEALAEAIKSTEQIVEELKEVFERLGFIFPWNFYYSIFQYLSLTWKFHDRWN